MSIPEYRSASQMDIPEPLTSGKSEEKDVPRPDLDAVPLQKEDPEDGAFMGEVRDNVET